MSTFADEDKKFQRKILNALTDRYYINMNKEVGTTHFSPIHEDRINPCVTINYEDIARETGRAKVRKVVLTQYAAAMRDPSIEVTEDLQQKTLRICIAPVRAPEVEFKSLDAMFGKNADDLAKDPELAADPFA